MVGMFKKGITITREILGIPVPSERSLPLQARVRSNGSPPRLRLKRKAVGDPGHEKVQKRPRANSDHYKDADFYEGSEARKMQLNGPAPAHPMGKRARHSAGEIVKRIQKSGLPPATKTHGLEEAVQEFLDDTRRVQDAADDFEMRPVDGELGLSIDSSSEPSVNLGHQSNAPAHAPRARAALGDTNAFKRWSTASAPARYTGAAFGESAPTRRDLGPNNEARMFPVNVEKDVVEVANFKPKGHQREDQKAQPEYTIRDVEIRNGLWHVMENMESFATNYFDFKGFDDTAKNRSALSEAFTNHLQPQTIEIIGSVASGGPNGEDGWRELFFGRQKRCALVCAIVGNVICEQVYRHAFFGGLRREVGELERIQRQNQDEDGFVLNRLYAQRVVEMLGHQPRRARDLQLPSAFHDHVRRIVEAIDDHLEVFRELSDAVKSHKHLLKSYVADLYELVAQAGILSLLMRVDPHTAYYNTPVIKEHIVQLSRVDCFNHEEMERVPTPAGKAGARTSPRPVSMGKAEGPVTQIVILGGMAAYRKGGWETSESKAWNVKYEDERNGNKRGIRSRTLTHDWVFCRWGRPRTFEDPANFKRSRFYGNSSQRDGFVEFREVEGVRNPQTGKVNVKGPLVF